MIKQQNGFTLVELMITVVLMGIIAAVASSSYTSFIVSANRTDGRTTLLESSAVLEKCKAIYGTYTNNCSIEAATEIPSKEGHYNITVSNLTGTTFTLTASPLGVQLDDTLCTSISLNHLSVQSGTGSDITECW